MVFGITIALDDYHAHVQEGLCPSGGWNTILDLPPT